MMRAQVLEHFNAPYVLRDIPIPPLPTGRDIVVETLAASYCHTDAVFASGAMWQGLPRVGSHEFCGRIIALGPEVSQSLHLSVGQLVGVPGRAFHPCGTCFECTHNDGDPDGYGVWCTKAGNLGLSIDGGFAEYAVADSRQVAPVPDGMEAIEVAPLMCAGLTIWNALEAAGVQLQEGGGKGKSIGVIGAGGGLGHLGVQFAIRLGCDVVAVDIGEKQLDLLKKVVGDMGEDGKRVTIVDSSRQKAEDVRIAVFGQPVENLEGEKGCDGVLILPEAQKALDYGFKLLRNHSTLITISFPKEGFHIQPRDLVFRHITMKGVLVGRNRQLRAMLDFAASHNVRAESTLYSLEGLNRLVEDYHHGACGKLVVAMKK